MQCRICSRDGKGALALCKGCSVRLRERLADLPSLHKEAHYCLQPQRGGYGTNTGEMTVGVNLSALDFVAGQTILNTLHEWEKVIRAERNLSPVALVPKQPTVEAEVSQTVRFHLSHLDWSLEQEWVDEYAREIAEVHSTGMTAARRFIDPIKRLPCPTTNEDGSTCNALIAVKGDDLFEPLHCRKCESDWTAARLIAVATNTPGIEIWLDTEAIAEWTGITERQVRNVVTKHKLERKGQLIDLQAFNRIRLRGRV
jgi:hypothetical protein